MSYHIRPMVCFGLHPTSLWLALEGLKEAVKNYLDELCTNNVQQMFPPHTRQEMGSYPILVAVLFLTSESFLKVVPSVICF